MCSLVCHQIDLENEKHVVLDEELELQKRQIWEIEKQTGGFEEYDRELLKEGEVLKKRLHTLQVNAPAFRIFLHFFTHPSRGPTEYICYQIYSPTSLSLSLREPSHVEWGER